MKYALRIVFAAILVLGLAACGSSSNGGNGTAPPSYAGKWSGEVNDTLAGSGAISANLTQSGDELGGTWQATYADSTSNSGSALGLINGSDVILELYPSDPTSCPFRVVASRSGNTLEGTYAAFDCTISVSGEVTLTKD